ncbi:hypothetical protein RUM43_001877 [Polyplax serrata]|uniref:Uncharacterized protein n=1 Tax=Polyplax serrata TaxID=468196 RepID=A0AAN8XUP4_POLSC
MKEKIIKEDEWDAKKRIKGKVSRLKRRTRTERKNAKVKDADGKFLSVEEVERWRLPKKVKKGPQGAPEKTFGEMNFREPPSWKKA